MKTKKFKLDTDKPARLSEEAKRHYDETPDEAIDYSDIPDYGDVDWSSLRPKPNTPKPSVTMRLDESVIAFFKSQDPKGYTARMASVLRAYVAAHQPK